ncbi:MAG: hypothetical protein CMJ52_05885 [Planctomycetaceae bacterium]|nr:hypothetical protein [Planctomycetaceae bacterium]
MSPRLRGSNGSRSIDATSSTEGVASFTASGVRVDGGRAPEASRGCGGLASGAVRPSSASRTAVRNHRHGDARWDTNIPGSDRTSRSDGRPARWSDAKERS